MKETEPRNMTESTQETIKGSVNKYIPFIDQRTRNKGESKLEFSTK